MGLFKKLFLRTKSIESLSVLMLGLDNAGKTTLLYKLKLGSIATTIPTIGFNVETLTYKQFSIDVWDVGGQDRIRPLWRHYYEKARFLIYVVDSCDIERFAEAGKELAKLSRDLSVPILIFANKQDCSEAKTLEHIAREMKLAELPGRNKWQLIPCSAKTGDNLYTGLEWVVSEATKQRRMYG